MKEPFAVLIPRWSMFFAWKGYRQPEKIKAVPLMGSRDLLTTVAVVLSLRVGWLVLKTACRPNRHGLQLYNTLCPINNRQNKRGVMRKAITHAVLFIMTAVILSSGASAGEITDTVSLETLPPSVIKTVPQCGSVNVDPNLTEISVTFSKEMKVTGHCWSWCYVQENSFPKLIGDPKFLEDRRTCVLTVELEPDKTYGIWANVDKFQSFQDPEGHPAVPYLLVFRTGSGK